MRNEVEREHLNITCWIFKVCSEKQMELTVETFHCDSEEAGAANCLGHGILHSLSHWNNYYTKLSFLHLFVLHQENTNTV